MWEEFCAVTLPIALFVYFGASLIGVASLHRGNVWSEPDVDLLRTTLAEPSLLMTVPIFVFLSGSLHTSVHRRLIANLLHCLHQGLALVIVWTAIDDETSLHWQVNDYVSRMLYAALYGNAPLVFALNAISGVCHTANLAPNPRATHAKEVFVFSACIFTALTKDWHMRSMARATVTALSSSRSEATAHALLSATCDAVVHLDSDLVVEASQKLDALLLRRAASRSVLGTYFPLLLQNTDRDRFELFVRGGEKTGTSLRVDLVDQGGTTFEAEIFHECLKDGERVSHIIGIREEHDGMELRRSAHDWVRPLPSSNRDTCSICSSFGTDTLSIRGLGGRMALWVETESDNLSMVSCTASFALLGGPIEQGEGFVGWLDDNQEDFLKWVRNPTTTDANVPESPTTIMVRLVPPRMRSFEFRARCTVSEGGCIAFYDLHRWPKPLLNLRGTRGTSARVARRFMFLDRLALRTAASVRSSMTVFLNSQDTKGPLQLAVGRVTVCTSLREQ
eukprot:CAMPEP_0194518394 /NCGR_PEP_ID=MMETSP0253-20130528/51793_1 /TAXON_ID=2966 /ORGANISM="Noctiluca scintillans" /LENGTH=505 /DNA_ID=CAMNT_0039362435 /DNA_START=252 /DNA_END=1770 /DNA_ORIENTATION=-